MILLNGYVPESRVRKRLNDRDFEVSECDVLRSVVIGKESCGEWSGFVLRDCGRVLAEVSSVGWRRVQ